MRLVRPIWNLTDQLARLPPLWLLIGAWTVFAVLSGIAMIGESITMDEGIALSSGYTHAGLGDFRLNPEAGPLSKIVAALPLLVTPVRLPQSPAAWKSADMGVFGFQFLYQSGNDPDRILFLGRLPTILWSLLLIGSVYVVAREIYGPKGGVIALILTTFCPTLLAHGHLATQDVPVTTLFFLTVVAYWKLEGGGNWKWAVYCGLLLGAAVTAKYSAVLLLPILGAYSLVCAVRTRAVRGGNPDQDPGRNPATGRVRAAHLCVIGLVAWFTLWGIYGFRHAGSPDPSYRSSWSFPLTGDGVTARACRFLSDEALLPEAFAYGVEWQNEHQERGHAAYALGDYTQVGWWWYFPLATLVKTPICALVLFAWGGWSCVRRGIRKGPELELLLLPVFIYGAFAVFSRVDIGVRYLLPVYPFLGVLAGAIERSAVPTPGPARRDALKNALLGLTAAGVLASTPYYLAYFNLPSSLLFHPHYLLVDSNLDWGQDLGRLKSWMDREEIPMLKLAYFGFGSPRHLELRHEVLPADNPYSRLEEEWSRASPFRAGDVVAISATALVGALHQDHEYYLRVFRKMKPIASIGRSIFVYRLPDSFAP
jgi:hypothetical protein